MQGFAEDAAVGVLVGESLMRAASPAGLIRELLGQPPPRTLCKVCGLRTPEAILAATEAGADLLGMIFDPNPSPDPHRSPHLHLPCISLTRHDLRARCISPISPPYLPHPHQA